MPGRLAAGLWTLNPDTGVRIAPGSQLVTRVTGRKVVREYLDRDRGVVKGYGYFSCPENTPYPQVPSSQSCEVIQLARITGSDPVHARSNRAPATTCNTFA